MDPPVAPKKATRGLWSAIGFSAVIEVLLASSSVLLRGLGGGLVNRKDLGRGRRKLLLEDMGFKTL